ncbi:MAG: type II toxin-antitoxin system HipA family toxin [Oligoflexus sp.]
MVKRLEKLHVFLREIYCGDLFMHEGVYRFRYDKDYLSRQTIPLSVSLPLEDREFVASSFSRTRGYLPEFFESLLPEGWLENVARQFNLIEDDRLLSLERLCRSPIGYVTFSKTMTPEEPSEKDLSSFVVERPGIASDDAFDFSVNPCELCVYCGKELPRPGYNYGLHDDCSRRFFGTAKAPLLALTKENLVSFAHKQLSDGQALTGVQPKLSVLLKSRTTLPSRRYILKPEPRDVFYQNLPGLEASIMDFARVLGFRVAEGVHYRLQDSTSVYIVKRFDYDQNGQRIHSEDCLAALGGLEKYKDGSHEKIAKLIKEHPAYDEKFRKDDLKEYFRLTLFNFMIGNADAHLKNHSLFHYIDEKDGKAKIRLTPAYDLVPARQFESGDDEDLGLSLGGRKKKIGRKDFDNFCQYLEIPKATTTHFLNKMRSNREQLIGILNKNQIPQEKKKTLFEYIASKFHAIDKK